MPPQKLTDLQDKADAQQKRLDELSANIKTLLDVIADVQAQQQKIAKLVGTPKTSASRARWRS